MSEDFDLRSRSYWQRLGWGVSGAYTGLFSLPAALLVMILESAQMQTAAYYDNLLIAGLAGALGFSLFFGLAAILSPLICWRDVGFGCQSAFSPDSAGFGRRLPIFQGILPLDRTQIPLDIVAGITLAALAIPEVMGYTQIAGMPAVTGLYTILIPMALFAIFGSSRHLVVGADSATAAIMASDLSTMPNFKLRKLRLRY